MEDRGEKIVTLARAMLHAKDNLIRNPINQPEHHPISIKILCITALLSALGGSVVTKWIDEYRQPISHYEKIELEALVYYTSKTKGLSEKSIREEIANTFSIEDFNLLIQSDYKRIRDYLRFKAK